MLLLTHETEVLESFETKENFKSFNLIKVIARKISDYALAELTTTRQSIR